jgi:hypothetical protein
MDMGMGIGRVSGEKGRRESERNGICVRYKWNY